MIAMIKPSDMKGLLSNEFSGNAEIDF